MYVCGTTRPGAVALGGHRPLGNPKVSGDALRPCPYVDELALESCPDVAQHRSLLQVPGAGRGCVTGCRGGTGRATRPQKCPGHPVGSLGHSLELGQVLQPVLLPRLLVAHDGQAAQRLHLHGASVRGHQGTAAPSAMSHPGGFDRPKTPSCDLKSGSPTAASAGPPWKHPLVPNWVPVARASRIDGDGCWELGTAPGTVPCEQLGTGGGSAALPAAPTPRTQSPRGGCRAAAEATETPSRSAPPGGTTEGGG